jgi:hypothetical protein
MLEKPASLEVITALELFIDYSVYTVESADLITPHCATPCGSRSPRSEAEWEWVQVSATTGPRPLPTCSQSSR